MSPPPLLRTFFPPGGSYSKLQLHPAAWSGVLECSCTGVLECSCCCCWDGVEAWFTAASCGFPLVACHLPAAGSISSTCMMLWPQCCLGMPGSAAAGQRHSRQRRRGMQRPPAGAAGGSRAQLRRRSRDHGSPCQAPHMPAIGAAAAYCPVCSKCSSSDLWRQQLLQQQPQQQQPQQQQQQSQLEMLLLGRQRPLEHHHPHQCSSHSHRRQGAL